MKSTVKSPFYFSAYPLKAVDQPSADKDSRSPYLRALLSGKHKTANRTAKVLPMINPYNKQPKPASFEAGKLPTDIELTEKDWFSNYE